MSKWHSAFHARTVLSAPTVATSDSAVPAAGDADDRPPERGGGGGDPAPGAVAPCRGTLYITYCYYYLVSSHKVTDIHPTVPQLPGATPQEDATPSPPP